MQTCPEYAKAPVRFFLTEESISALSSTMTAAFPPSSSVTNFLFARDLISQPTFALPVNEIIFTRSSA